MLRVCRPGGVVAARDADYAAMTWYPDDPVLDRWPEIYRTVAHGNGAEPDAGRRLLAWAGAAGAGSITPSASAWSYATPEERAWWGGMWAERILSSSITRQAVDGGYATAGELADIAAAWRRWGRRRGRLVRDRPWRGAAAPVTRSAGSQNPSPVAAGTLRQAGRPASSGWGRRTAHR